MKRNNWALTASLLAFTAFAPIAAHAQADEQAIVERAATTISDLRHDKEFGTAKQLLRTARAVLIVPRLYKAGFFVGGEGGDGVLLTRTGSGWSAPAFYGIGSASFGLQIGAQESEMVLFVMSQKALTALMANQFKIGANAGIAVVTLGSSVEGATTSAAGADIVTWASSSGAYAGISLNGSVIKPSPDHNRGYYGKPVTPRQILASPTGAKPPAGNQSARALQLALENVNQ